MSKRYQELPIIQKTYDLIVWYVPLLNKLPRDHKFNLGDRIITTLYTLLEELLVARYSREKLPLLHYKDWGYKGFLRKLEGQRILR